MIYLDYSATTPVDSGVLDTFNKVTKEYIGNANSLHSLGVKSKRLMDSATNQIAELFGIKEKEITYLQSSTECNNLALIGSALAHKNHGNHIIVSKLEHPSIYSICNYLESLGFKISYVNNNEEGIVDFEDLKRLVTKDTIIVSICAVNSELGIRQPLKMLRQIIKKENPDAIFHSDMTQAIGKTPVVLKDVDMASISSHKIYGLKGIAMLYKYESINISPIIYGSGKSNDLKPGTPALPLIVSFSKALRLAIKNLPKSEKYTSLLNERICKRLSYLKDVKINKTQYSIPQILNISVMNIKPETFLHALDNEEIYVSTNTACSSGNISSAIMAVYNDEKRAAHTIRISLSHLTASSDITEFLDAFEKIYQSLNDLGDNK